MKCLLLSLALMELLLWHTGSGLFLDENCDRSLWEVDPTNTPWMAAVSNELGFLCGGTLITKKFVLTAAQCIRDQESLFVQLGVKNRSDVTGEQYNVSRTIIHRAYVYQPPGPNDIGLLELHAEVNYTDRIRPICILMVDSAELRKIKGFTGFGWGVTETGHTSQELLDIRLRRGPSEECRYYPIVDGQFCAYSPVDDSTCNGDAGGPLVATAKNRTVQVGIISYGSADCHGPTICTDVASYTDWLAANAH